MNRSKSGNWDEEMVILSKICNLFPFRSNIYPTDIGNKSPTIMLGNSRCNCKHKHQSYSLKSLCDLVFEFKTSWAFGLALLVELVPVARTLVLVPIGPRRNTFALSTAYSTVPQTPILNPCRWASVRTLVAAISCHQHTKLYITSKYSLILYFFFIAVTEKSYMSLHRLWLAPRKRSLEEENIIVGCQRQASLLQVRTLATVVGVSQEACYGISKSMYL